MLTRLALSDPNVVWPYCPSYAAAVLFAVLYGLTTFTHLAQAILYRKGFCWVIIMAASWEFAGFAIRAAGTQYQGSLGLFFFQQVLILLAPIWLNAFVYMVFGRMVLYFLPDQKVAKIKAKRLTLIFVLLDVVYVRKFLCWSVLTRDSSFLVQLGGGSMLSNTDANTIQLGQRLYMSGIGIQLFFFTLFLGLTVHFYRKAQQAESRRQTNWRWLLYVIYAEYVLIAVRIIFRLVEFSAGVDGPVPHTESYFFVFDALTILVALVLFCMCHPGRILVGPESEFKKMSRAEKRQLKQYKKLGRPGADGDGQRPWVANPPPYLGHGDEEHNAGIELRTDVY